MSTQLFEKHITDLNFSLLDNEEKRSGVLFTDSFEQLNPEWVSPNILFAVETAKIKFQANAIFFRYFEDGRGFIPQLYLFDRTDRNLTNDEKNHIHIKMWNGYQVPAYIIIEKSSVSIFDSRKRPKEDVNSYAKEILTLTGKAIKDYNAKEFESGIFWDEQNEKKNFQFEESATKDLIRGLKEIFRKFTEESELNRHVALKLLVQSLLIKYLEERDVTSASGYFAGTYFKKNFQCSNFCETIRKGKLLNLLDKLAKDFNGKIFEWDKESEIDARNAIQQTEIQNLADYLDGNIKNSQYVLWRLYSFNHLPVEVISSVYEELLTDSKDIVYTPEMIVSTLVDECMPLKSPQRDFKIIDVSCGSGIFLVKTYKRIVQWWRYEEWKRTGKLVKPPLPVLKELLLKNIHGVDIEPDAIRLSIFSLALAILDEVNLDPPTWGKLKFPDLSENIITQDFFEFIMTKPNANFDLVIGNPPFNPPKDELNKAPSNGNYFKQLRESHGYLSEIKIPDENPALHFLVQSLKLLKQNGLLCLIEPSGPLLYQKGLSFKHDLFSQYNLLQVIDFTKLTFKLWGPVKVAAAAVFIRNTPPDDKDVLHLIANNTLSNTNRLFLEFDHYDFHFISKSSTINDSYAWKANLLGGGRLNHLMNRLSKIRSLGDFLEDKKLNGWVKGEGFRKKSNYSGTVKDKADYITGKDFLPTKSFDENGIDKSAIRKCEIEYFDRSREKNLYEPPHLLIRKVLGKNKLITAYSDRYLTFQEEIYAIHAPLEEQSELIRIADYFKNNDQLIRFFILASSGRAKVNRGTSLNDDDILRIPFPQGTRDVKISEADQLIINDVMDSMNFSKEVISTIKEEISKFSSLFCKTLNSIYKSSKNFQLFKIIDSGKFLALHFEYSSEKIIPKTESARDIEKYIESTIPLWNEKTDSYHIQKIIKVYGQDSIILAKPKQLRYWLPSIALRDADETFAEYFKSRHVNA